MGEARRDLRLGRVRRTDIRDDCRQARDELRLFVSPDIDLARSAFYSDSYNDLPMLERVGTPVAVNPDQRLRRHARRAGWRIEQWA